MLEVFSRAAISLITINKTVLLYGINDTKIYMDRLRKLDFFVVSKKKIADLYKTSDIDIGDTDTPQIWVFGGSTTEGSNCKQAQSWPLLLSNDLTGYEIRNFGRNGKNSDFSIEKLESELLKNKPSLVLWANRANEANVLSWGFKRNGAKIISKNQNSEFLKNKVIYYNKAFFKSAEKYSVGIFILKSVIKRLIDEPFFTKKVIYSKEELGKAIENYSLNTDQAIRLSKIKKFKFVIVTLFNKKDIMEKPKKLPFWDERMFDVIRKFSFDENVFWINTIDYVKENFDPDTLLCDDAHQTLQGNELVAKSVFNGLLQNGLIF